MISFPFIVEVAGHATGHDDIPHQSMAECVIGCAQHAFSQHAAKGVHQHKGGIIADCPDIAEMVGKPLEFGEQRSEPNRAIGHDKFQGRLGRARKRIGIGDGAVA